MNRNNKNKGRRSNNTMNYKSNYNSFKTPHHRDPPRNKTKPVSKMNTKLVPKIIACCLFKIRKYEILITTSWKNKNFCQYTILNYSGNW